VGVHLRAVLRITSNFTVFTPENLEPRFYGHGEWRIIDVETVRSLFSRVVFDAAVAAVEGGKDVAYIGGRAYCPARFLVT
jgi:hypothetical protein